MRRVWRLSPPPDGRHREADRWHETCRTMAGVTVRYVLPSTKEHPGQRYAVVWGGDVRHDLSMAEVDDGIALVSHLGDRCNGHPEQVDAALPQVLEVLRNARCDDLLVAIAEALGRMWDPRCLDPLLGLIAHA